MTKVELGIKPSVALIATEIAAAFLVNPWFLLAPFTQVLVSCFLIGYTNARR